MIWLFLVIIYSLQNSIQCQLQCLERPLTPTGPLGVNYIGTQTISDNGTCTNWATALGNVNYLNPSQFPDITVQDAQNYCRNPRNPTGTYEPRPWCWLQSNPRIFGNCTIPSCEGICRTTYLGDIYRGNVATTITKKTCQSWSVTNPHSHSFTSANWGVPNENIAQAENKCRNPNNSSIGLWCYTTDPNTVWEPCMAPVCQSSTNCPNDTNRYTFKSLTTTEQYLQDCVPWRDVIRDYYNHSSSLPSPPFTSSTVQPIFHPALLPDDTFDSANNYCRNPDNDAAGAWCYVKNGAIFRKMYCKTPCSGIWACLYDRIGSYYQGIVNTTEQNITCLPWNSITPPYSRENFPENSVDLASNYCRNPNNSPGGPWCWTAANRASFGFCAIPICKQTPPLAPLVTANDTRNCKVTPTGIEYNGTLSVTGSGMACQRWDVMSPSNPYFNRPILFRTATMAEVSNYCRNPDNDPNGPWCFTAENKKEFCRVPLCFPATRNNCRTTLKGLEYTGTINKSAYGEDCRAWSSITNLAYNANSFPDDSIQNAFNYCRNPNVPDQFGPFCFIANGSRQPCVVPMCNTSTCLNTVEGYTYNGQQSTSLSGKPCLPWSTIGRDLIKVNFLPDNSLNESSNFCRNPTDNNAYFGPFCFTSNSVPETCGINNCSAQCRNTITAQDYKGFVNRASTGVCRAWASNTNLFYRNPSSFNAATMEEASNYCRNPNNDYQGPWCYTEPQVVAYCQLPICSPSPNCYLPTNAWAYTGNVSVTASGKECAMWSQSENMGFPGAPLYTPSLLPDASVAAARNYCRAPTNDTTFNRRPWCFLKSPTLTEPQPIVFEYCNVTVCDICYTFSNVSKFNGYINTTLDGTPCLAWSNLSNVVLSNLTGPTFLPSLLVDADISSANNYCRTPTSMPQYLNQPWCFVSPTSSLSKSTGQNFGFCDVKYCNVSVIPPITIGTAFVNFIMPFSVALAALSLSNSIQVLIGVTTNLLDTPPTVLQNQEDNHYEQILSSQNYSVLGSAPPGESSDTIINENPAEGPKIERIYNPNDANINITINNANPISSLQIIPTGNATPFIIATTSEVIQQPQTNYPRIIPLPKSPIPVLNYQEKGFTEQINNGQLFLTGNVGFFGQAGQGGQGGQGGLSGLGGQGGLGGLGGQGGLGGFVMSGGYSNEQGSGNQGGGGYTYAQGGGFNNQVMGNYLSAQGGLGGFVMSGGYSNEQGSGNQGGGGYAYAQGRGFNNQNIGNNGNWGQMINESSYSATQGSSSNVGGGQVGYSSGEGAMNSANIEMTNEGTSNSGLENTNILTTSNFENVNMSKTSKNLNNKNSEVDSNKNDEQKLDFTTFPNIDGLQSEDNNSVGQLDFSIQK